jgi:hypothetical protein
MTSRLIEASWRTFFRYDPAPIFILGCFGKRSIKCILGRDVSIFPFVDGMMDFQIIAETDSTKPVSQHRMNQLFKALMLEVLEVGFPEDVMAYSLQPGFMRDMFSFGLLTDLIRKFLHPDLH